MDLSNLELAKDTSKCYLRHPVTDEWLTDDDGNQMYIEGYGRDSAKYKNKVNEQQNELLKRQQRGKIKLTSEAIDQNANELLAECVSSWHVVVGGEKPECNSKSAIDLFKKLPWVREQFDAHIHDRANFFTS